MMKSKLFVLLTVMLAFYNVYAQNENIDVRRNTKNVVEIPKEMQKKVKAHKIAFLTEELNLTTEEAEKFWPVYNEFEEKKRTEHKNASKWIQKTPEEIENMTENEAMQMVKEIELHHQKMLSLEEEYQAKFLNVLSAKKVLKLHRAERKFRRELIKKLKRESPKRGEKRRGF